MLSHWVLSALRVVLEVIHVDTNCSNLLKVTILSGKSVIFTHHSNYIFVVVQYLCCQADDNFLVIILRAALAFQVVVQIDVEPTGVFVETC
jgi:hypothetical protein